MKASLAVGVLAMTLVHPCAAQARTAVPMKTSSAAPLDSVRRRYHDTLLRTRDTIATVRSSLGQFQRDLPTVSGETILSRASVLIERCRATQQLMMATEPVFDPSKAPARPPRARPAAANLTTAMRTLRADLEATCINGFARQRADTLRAWAGFRGVQIERALQKYEQAVSEFEGAADFQLEPVVRTH